VTVDEVHGHSNNSIWGQEERSRTFGYFMQWLLGLQNSAQEEMATYWQNCYGLS
jgi:hypothetical protein